MKKLNNILIPVDFSECSNNALEYAFKLIDSTGGKITILHAYHFPYTLPEGANTITPGTIQMLEENVDEEFSKLKNQYRQDQDKIDSYLKVASFGMDAIKSELKNKKYNLVIMGTNGASGLSEILMGSVTANVIENTEVPVLCIPSVAKYTGIQNILFACDYEEMHEADQLNILKFFAESFGACIHLVNIKENSEAGHFEEAVYLESFFSNIKHTHTTSRFKNFEAGINDFVENNAIDLLAIMPRKKNIFQKLFGSSHTRKLAYHSKLPFLAFHE